MTDYPTITAGNDITGGGPLRPGVISADRATKIGLRILQIVNERGVGTYDITVRLDDNGQLWLLPPPKPAKEERIG